MEASTIKLNKICVSLIFPISKWVYFSVLYFLLTSIVLLRWRVCVASLVFSSSLNDFFRGAFLIAKEFFSLAVTFSIVVMELEGIFITLGVMDQSIGLWLTALALPQLFMRANACEFTACDVF